MNSTTSSLVKSSQTAVNSVFDNVFFSYVFWVFLAIVIFILMVMAFRFLSTYLGNQFVAHSNISDVKYQDRVNQLVSDSIFYVGIIFSAFICFQIV